jgi:hypothetical protein
LALHHHTLTVPVVPAAKTTWAAVIEAAAPTLQSPDAVPLAVRRADPTASVSGGRLVVHLRASAPTIAEAARTLLGQWSHLVEHTPIAGWVVVGLDLTCAPPASSAWPTTVTACRPADKRRPRDRAARRVARRTVL